jgi:hypothetical protein
LVLWRLRLMNFVHYQLGCEVGQRIRLPLGRELLRRLLWEVRREWRVRVERRGWRLVGMLMVVWLVGQGLRRQLLHRLGGRVGGKGLEHPQHSYAGCEKDRR